MMRLFIEPSDVWTFGDGRPFEAGEDHRRMSLFPPNAQTLQGAIRSRVLADAGVSFEAYRQHDPSCVDIANQIGWPGEGYGKLRLHGPFLARLSDDRLTIYYPLPTDVLTIQNKDGEGEYRAAEPLADPIFVNDAPDGLCPLWLRDERATGATGWLSGEALGHYLNCETLAQSDVTQTDALFAKESRFGVTINSTIKRPQEGHLFQMEFVRPRKGVGLVIDVEGASLKQPHGLLQLGGDARSARYRVLPGPKETVPRSLPTRFKVVLLTPAYFAQGWRPPDWRRWFQGTDIRLVAAAMHRSTPIGGFDLAKWQDKLQSPNPQRPLRRHVPAGSVFLFEANGSVTYTGESLTHDGAEIGFGQIAIGGWNYV